jgi:hypothetical protein
MDGPETSPCESKKTLWQLIDAIIANTASKAAVGFGAGVQL